MIAKFWNYNKMDLRFSWSSFIGRGKVALCEPQDFLTLGHLIYSLGVLVWKHMDLDESSVVNSVDDLVEFYRKTENGKDLYIGIEWERSGVYRDTLKPVTYEGDKGYLAVLKKLVAEAGWEIVDGYRNYIGELRRGEAKVTLEADGRLELAGSPKKNLHDLAREFRIHANEVKEVSDFFDIAWLPIGWQPFHNDKEIEFVKKKRYQIVNNFGDEKWAEAQMKRNNGLTANFSYSDEKNAIRKAQIGFRIMPVIGAIFASSPFNEGKISEYLDMRRFCVLNSNPERNVAPKNILSKDFSFTEWISFYTAMPVYLIKRKGKEDLMPENLTFDKWINEGYEGIFPTVYDFDQHVKATWSDIRLRPNYLEYRVADSVPMRYAMGVPALIKGLVFDSKSWRAVEDITKDWTYEDIIKANEEAWTHGLDTEIKGKTLLWYAKSLVHIANEALHKFARQTASSDTTDESLFLAPLKDQIYIKEKSIASEMVELWEKEWDKNPRRLIEWCEKDK